MQSEPEVFVVTSAQPSTSSAQKSRQITYLTGMSLRTFCFIGAIIASGVLRWVLVAGAILLPYFAVIVANAGRERGLTRMPTLFTSQNNKAIPSSSAKEH